MPRPSTVALLAIACFAWYAAAQPAGAAATDGAASCASPCFVVKDYWPVKSCKQECDPQVCNRGWGAWKSNDICCAPGVAFPEGCGKRLTECWVVESYQMRSCIRDDRKCLQGYGVWGTQEACCAAGAAFPEGCRTNITRAAQPCWVVDTYFPARLCRASNTLCGSDSGVQSWPTRETCCSTAFNEGCSESGPQAPCWVVDSYWPARRCRQENDIAACNRGWGVYQSKDVCCAKNVAFAEGCTPEGAATPDAATPNTPQPGAAAVQGQPAAQGPVVRRPAVPAVATVPAAPIPAAVLTPASVPAVRSSAGP